MNQEHPGGSVFLDLNQDMIDGNTVCCPEYEILIQLSGYRRVLTGSEDILLRPNDMMVFRPMEEHREVAVENMPQKHIQLRLPAQDVTQLLAMAQDEAMETMLASDMPVRLTPIGCFALENRLQDLQEEMQENSLLTQTSARLQAMQALVLACRFRQSENLNGGRSHRRSSIDQVVAFIDTNYANNVTLAGMAKVFETTSSALSRSFKKYTGMQPIAYLNQVRISAAKLLIGRTEMPLSQICTRVGYESQTYFGRVFKEAMGMTPSQYRKTQRQKTRKK